MKTDTQAPNNVLANTYKQIANEEFDKIKDKIATKEFSDVIDNDGNQYVNLIQEGGGVWGIALVGYTYILEMANIRFLKMAGTSAGAINTVLMAAMPNPEKGQLKSEKIVDLLSELDMFKFVDGHWVARKLIKNLITSDNYSQKVAFSFKVFLFICLGLLFVSNLLQWSNHSLNVFSITSLAVMGILSFVAFQRGKRHFLLQAQTGSITNKVENENQHIPKKLNWKHFVLIFISLIVVFSIGFLFSKCTNVVAYDLGLISLMALTITALHRKFDTDFVTIGSLLFIILPVLGFGIGSANIYTFLHISHYLMLVGILLCIIPFYIEKWLPRWFFYLIILIGLTIFFCSLGVMLKNETYSRFSYLSLVAVLLCTFLIAIVGGFVIYILKKFKDSEYGINPGDYFLYWIRSKLSEFTKDGSSDFVVSDLEKNWTENVKNIQLRPSRLAYNVQANIDSNLEDLRTYKTNKPPVVFISSEISTQNKVEFPRMKELYWQANEPVLVGDFVRASMAIPFFFEPYKREHLPTNQEENWRNFHNYDFNQAPLKEALFVDGGLLSNFPYNLFHNPAIKNARMPTFGIRMGDKESDSSTGFKGLFHYVYVLFNTSRYYYDRDFLLKNLYYQKSIAEIDMSGHNWLNFFLSNTEKEEMFRKGAKRACKFLLEFDWNEFREERNKAVAALHNSEEKEN